MGWKDTIAPIDQDKGSAKPTAAPSWRDTIEPATPAVNEQGVTDKERFLIKNLVSNEPEVAQTYLKKRGYDTRINNGEVEVKRPGEKDFKVIDPSDVSFKEVFKDLTDIVGDVAQTTAETAAEFIPGVGRTTAAPLTTAAFETEKQAIARYLGVREKYNPNEVALQAGLTAVMPSAVKYGGKAVKAASGGISDAIGWGAKKLGMGAKNNADEILKAGKELGIEIQPSQVIGSKTIRNLQEDITDRTLRPTGFFRRKAIKNANETASEVAKDIVSDRSGLDAAQAGSKAVMQMTDELAEKLKPAEEIYNKYENAFADVIPDLDGMKSQLSGYSKKFKLDKGAQSAINEADDIISQVKNLDDLKQARSAINSLKIEAQKGTQKRYVLENIYNDLTGIRSETLLKYAKEQGGEVFAQAKKDIGQADKIYRESIESVENVIGRGKTVKGSPKAALEGYFDKTREFDLTTKIFDTKDPARLAAIQKSFPKSFEILRTRKLEELAEKSTKDDVVNFRTLAQSIDKIPDESLVYLFGKDSVKDRALKAKALKTIGESIPNPSNPSGTGQRVARDVRDAATGFGIAAALSNPWAIALAAVPEVMAMTKNELLNVISNPVTRQGFLNKIANSQIENSKALGAAGRLGAKQVGFDELKQDAKDGYQGLMDLIPRN